ncbi:transporter substrate-binding domain-containing protein [Mesorhizobium sp. SB112]|uniref:transporter substrate-binding domain-containing protein n=1 Tax=Mesorhizobium sp. SB112 TaxID=3151853 RepID=UPI003263BB3E
MNAILSRLLCLASLSLALVAGNALDGTAQTLDGIKERKKIIIGIQAENVPWGFVDDKGQLDGYDIDISKMIARDLGVELELIRVTNPNRIAMLLSGKVDVLVAVVGMYPERAKVVQFSKPYSTLDVNVYAHKDSDIQSLGDLVGKRVGLSRAAAEDVAMTKQAQPGTILQRFDDHPATLQALISGQVDAIGGASTFAKILERAVGKDMFEPRILLQRQYNGVAMRPNDRDINVWVNAFIDRHITSGEIAKTYEKWIGGTLPDLPEELAGIPFTVQ